MNQTLPPRIVQLVGLGLIVAFSLFWALTGRVEPTLIAAAGGLVGIGQGLSALEALRAAGKGEPPRNGSKNESGNE